MHFFKSRSYWSLFAFAAAGFPASSEVISEWRVAGGDSASNQFSSLAQITPENVNDLEIAWVYHAGDGRADNRSQIQCNPIIVKGSLYGTTPGLKLISLNAATGEEIWRFDPFEGAGEN